MVDYHLGQRYHGPTSLFFREALKQVPLDEQWYEPCGRCGHTCFVEKSARLMTLVLNVPVLCAHCAVELASAAPPETVLNLEACPVAPCPFSNPLPK